MADEKIIDLIAISTQSSTDLYETSLNGMGSRKETRGQMLEYMQANIVSTPQALQDTYDTGNSAIIVMDENRPVIFENVSQGDETNAIAVPGTGFSTVGNYRVLGWTFTPTIDILISALQYEDALIESDLPRNTGIFVRDTQELLGSVNISNQDPLDSSNIFRTAVLDSPMQCFTGISYVWATVVPINEHDHQPTTTATPSDDIVLTERAQLPASSLGVSLVFPLTFDTIDNSVYLGSFQYSTFTIDDSVSINDTQTNQNTAFSVVSTIRASIPAPAMTQEQRDAIASPEVGGQVYVTDSSPPAINVWDGSAWQAEGGAAATIATTENLSDASFFIPFVASATTGDQEVQIFDGLSINPSTSALTVGPPQSKVGSYKLAILGADSSVPLGPNYSVYTDADQYPLFQQSMYSHDNMSFSFDCYFDDSGDQISSDAGSNFCIYKATDQLSFFYNSGIAPGSSMLGTRKTAMYIDTLGNLNLTQWLTMLNATTPPSMAPDEGGIIYFEGGEGKCLAPNGNVTVFAPLAPPASFSAYLSTTASAATGDGTVFVVACDDALFDIGSNFSGGIFTAPKTGRYWLKASAFLTNIGITHTGAYIEILTSHRTYRENIINPSTTAATGNLQLDCSFYCDMEIGDTAVPQILVSGGTKTVDVYGQASSLIQTSFQGFQVA